MSQRNALNERNTGEAAPKGQTRKSASTAKPKSQAASSVYVAPTTKTKEQKKAIAKANKEKERERNRAINSLKPNTDRYKKLRRIWWALLVGAVVCTVLSWFGRSFLPDPVLYTVLILAYVFIIAAFYTDFVLIRRERNAYNAAIITSKSKEVRHAQKEARAAQRAKEKEEAEKAANGQTEEEPKRGLFGRAKDKAVSGANAVSAKQAESGSITPKKDEK